MANIIYDASNRCWILQLEASTYCIGLREDTSSPYLLGIHQLATEQFHLHVEIQAIWRALGKLKYAASSESL